MRRLGCLTALFAVPVAAQAKCRAAADRVACTAFGHRYAMDFSSCRGALGLDSDLHVVGTRVLPLGSVWEVRLRNGSRLAFKTECRPPPMPRGQQGWTEVAVHHLSAALLGSENTVACAAGAVLPLFFGGELPAPAARVRYNCTRTPGWYIGAAMPWTMWSHRYMSPVVNRSWQIFRPKERPELTRPERLLAHQMGLLLTLDFVALNPDRHIFNWWRDRGKLIAMDNGAAFGGHSGWWSGWNGSICDNGFAGFLRCPFVFQYLLDTQLAHECERNTSSCGHSGGLCAASGVEWCLWKRELYERLQGFRAAWGKGLSAAWERGLLQDELFQYHFRKSNTWGAGKKLHRWAPANPHQVWSTALWRFVHGCPRAPRARDWKTAPPPKPSAVMAWLSYGIARRVDSVIAHVRGCVAKHGADYVFQL
eukprot:TRINITY_DN40509_c0_g1_i1.p1 TRINITY_DN40509_c0_g1~~TRINITY_DN40509_c0_g1_i1.p1  ORF type:complete len:453 (+),score=85.22 TRINITY_DN40509_c0_g1_i1:96-1361(+)